MLLKKTGNRCSIAECLRKGDVGEVVEWSGSPSCVVADLRGGSVRLALLWPASKPSVHCTRLLSVLRAPLRWIIMHSLVGWPVWLAGQWRPLGRISCKCGTDAMPTMAVHWPLAWPFGLLAWLAHCLDPSFCHCLFFPVFFLPLLSFCLLFLSSFFFSSSSSLLLFFFSPLLLFFSSLLLFLFSSSLLFFLFSSSHLISRPPWPVTCPCQYHHPLLSGGYVG